MSLDDADRRSGRVGGGRRRSLGAAYRPALDGVRALAVLAVMAHHFEPTLTGGFLGVDVFFVLSGYLITTLLIDEQLVRGQISLSRFYARRALRLLPAFLPLFVVVAICWAVRPYPSAFGLVGSGIAAIAYVGNWVVATTSNGLGYLSHTWSLAIEEQFYVLWPIGFMLLARRSSAPRTAAWLLGFSAAIGLVRAAGWLIIGTTALLYVTPTRADGLLFGCGIALLLRGLPQLRLWRIATAPLVGWSSAATLLLLFVFVAERQSTAYFGGVSLAVLCAGTLVVHLELTPFGSLNRLLASQPLPAIGRISYGLYLFHYPVAMLLYEPTGRTPLSFAVKFALSFILAIASYLVIERPALRLKRRFRADTPVVATA